MLCPRCHGTKTDPSTEGPCSFCVGAGTCADAPLSPHFELSELLVSEAAARKGLPNDPPDGYVERLRTLAADVLEPLRARFGPVHVNSGYRSPAVNAAIGGSATSAHMQGFAADLVPLTAGVTLKQMADWLISSDVPFDQVIFEGTWLHVGRFGPGGVVRREALMMFGGKYSTYDPADPRVTA